MEEKELRKQIIDACLYLQKKELIVRTWGNVSARLNENQFIITPSGLAYELTKPEDLVIVNIKDCSYDKNGRKPSSERLVHASAYKVRPDVNFIVHTHQLYASAVGAEEKNAKLANGEIIPCCKYGLPSTKKLQKNCENTFKKYTNANSFLMAKHGAICFGNDKKDALKNAEKLEKECKKLFDERVKNFYVPIGMKPYLDDFAQLYPLHIATKSDDEETMKKVVEKNAAAMLYAIKSKPLGQFDRCLQRIIYLLKYSKLRDK